MSEQSKKPESSTRLELDNMLESEPLETNLFLLESRLAELSKAGALVSVAMPGPETGLAGSLVIKLTILGSPLFYCEEHGSITICEPGEYGCSDCNKPPGEGDNDLVGIDPLAPKGSRHLPEPSDDGGESVKGGG